MKFFDNDLELITRVWKDKTFDNDSFNNLVYNYKLQTPLGFINCTFNLTSDLVQVQDFIFSFINCSFNNQSYYINTDEGGTLGPVFRSADDGDNIFLCGNYPEPSNVGVGEYYGEHLTGTLDCGDFIDTEEE